ncbi:uncharacterized protein [Syngnathus scovelli]|uniref:uncharacterized protein n=1 Tax=Syngnathus scovelli TaxID=161590 RepID=UPI0021107ACD|nr:uncharacterized protein LOC125978158 [Syngnathus scovelli]XP_049591220.1 uncharacterized protein LOC125978158 [Syngnathus scovelli]XP_049591221.1 uncharacterized protein LOC125978158 [Syngnathus scovelli]
MKSLVMSQRCESTCRSLSSCQYFGNRQVNNSPTMEMENYYIKEEVILPLVQKYFERIQPAQWSMLATGTIDSATQVILADMCTDITQKLCADTIRVIIPEFKQRIQSAEKKRMRLKVEGGLSTAFASALSVPEQRSKSSQKLDSLFKREISQRINDTLSSATSTASQLVPLIYIPGTFTKIEVLAKMVQLACGALKVYLGKMYTMCFRPCWRQKSRQEPPCDSRGGNMCIFNYEETTEAVMNILRKWTDGEDKSVRTDHELKKTAAEIVTTIINELHYPESLEEGRSRSSTPHFNLGLIKDQLCEFFETCASPNSSNEFARKRNFLNFCQKKFDQLTFELEKVRCRCMQMRREEEESRRGTPALDGDNLLSFQGIQPGLEDVFHKVALPPQGVSVDVHELRLEADKFSIDLADKIYHFMTTNRTTIQSDAVWRRFSEPLILEVDEEKPENIQVLHKMVEDTSTKFVQQLLLWLKMEPVTRENHADEVYGCLNDIDTLIMGTAMPQAKEDVDSDNTKSESPPDTQEGSITTESRISQNALETDSAQAKTPPSGVVRVAWPSPLRPPSAEEKRLHRHTMASQPKSSSSEVTPGRSTSVLEEMITSLMAVLVVQLLTRIQKKHKKVVLSRDTLPIIQRLSKKVLQDPSLCVITEANIYSINKVMKAVVKEILREFDCMRQLPEAFLSNDLSFDNTLLKLLMVNLEALKVRQQRRTRKFFSAVRRLFRHTLCMRASTSKKEILPHDETASEASLGV